MPFNADLADQVLAQIKAHPESWNQQEWAVKPAIEDEVETEDSAPTCETAFCFAGWACFFSGIGFEYAEKYIGDDDALCLVGYQTDSAEEIQTVAERLLGIPRGDGIPLDNNTGLFDSYNSLEEIEAIVAEYKSGERESVA